MISTTIMKTLFLLNDAPYGNERCYNALRLAGALSKREGHEVKVFLIGDAISCANKGQKVPQGYYNIEVMLRNVARNKAETGICGTCMDARGVTEDRIAEGSKRSTLEELADWTVWADKVLVF